MIRVLQVLTDTNIGGAGIWLLNFLKTYDRESLDVSVVVPKGSQLEERVRALDVRCITAENIADKSFSLAGIKTLKALISAEKPDIVHTHASLSARIASKLSGVKAVNTRHCIEPPKSGLKKIIYGFINRYFSDSSVGVSDAVCKNLLDDGIPENKLYRIYNGVVPLEKLAPEKRGEVRRKYGLDTKTAVGIFARLEPVKNHMLFLRAASRAYAEDKSLTFLIVGDGSLTDSLKAEAERLGISEAVVFTGYVTDVTELMNAIDINVLTSESEAMSISLVEAMSVAKPCITTDSGGPREVVSDGVSGIIVSRYGEEELARAIIRLAREPELRQTMGEAGEKTAHEKFSPSEMCTNLLTMYKNMCGKAE